MLVSWTKKYKSILLIKQWIAKISGVYFNYLVPFLWRQHYYYKKYFGLRTGANCTFRIHVINVQFLWSQYLKRIFFFAGNQSFLWGHWYPCFGLLVTSVLGFKPRVDTLACVLHYLHAMDSPDSSLVRHLLTSSWLKSSQYPETAQSVRASLPHIRWQEVRLPLMLEK